MKPYIPYITAIFAFAILPFVANAKGDKLIPKATPVSSSLFGAMKQKGIILIKTTLTQSSPNGKSETTLDVWTADDTVELSIKPAGSKDFSSRYIYSKRFGLLSMGDAVVNPSLNLPSEQSPKISGYTRVRFNEYFTYPDIYLRLLYAPSFTRDTLLSSTDLPADALSICTVSNRENPEAQGRDKLKAQLTEAYTRISKVDLDKLEEQMREVAAFLSQNNQSEKEFNLSVGRLYIKKQGDFIETINFEGKDSSMTLKAEFIASKDSASYKSPQEVKEYDLAARR